MHLLWVTIAFQQGKKHCQKPAVPQTNLTFSSVLIGTCGFWYDWAHLLGIWNVPVTVSARLSSLRTAVDLYLDGRLHRLLFKASEADTAWARYLAAGRSFWVISSHIKAQKWKVLLFFMPVHDGPKPQGSNLGHITLGGLPESHSLVLLTPSYRRVWEEHVCGNMSCWAPGKLTGSTVLRPAGLWIVLFRE